MKVGGYESDPESPVGYVGVLSERSGSLRERSWRIRK